MASILQLYSGHIFSLIFAEGFSETQWYLASCRKRGIMELEAGTYRYVKISIRFWETAHLPLP